jgi:hypothetical protein
MSGQRFVQWPLVQHPHALADREADARPLLDRSLEDAARFVEVVASIEHETRPAARPGSTSAQWAIGLPAAVQGAV